MRTPAHDTAVYLTAQGITAAVGGPGPGPGGGQGPSNGQWPVYVGREPLTPVDVVTVYDTGGARGPLTDLRVPTVQVRVRSATYDAGWQKANEIFEALVVQINQATTNATILEWAPNSDVAFIGRDDQDRPLFTANFQMMRDGVSA